MSASSDRRLDLVVFGATSFVGQILCRYLVERHGTSGEVRWAIAGRNAAKLDQVAKDTGADVERIVADASDIAALDEMVAATRVVISTVGPYALYGSELVGAAARAGTDYCDLTGEPQWMRKMIDEHHDTAVKSGARIVHACGFDSIPSDLGVWFTQQVAQRELGSHCVDVAMRVKAMRGGASGGTIASMMHLVEEASSDAALRKLLADPFALLPADLAPGARQNEVTVPQRDEASGEWLAPFVMASVNTKVVHRSHALLGRPWTDGFMYREALSTGAGPLGAAKAGGVVAGLGGFMGLSAIGPVRSFLNDRVLPKPGEGPDHDAQERGFFDIRFVGTTADGRTVETKVTGDRDPGYGSTAKMLGESAVCLMETPTTDVVGGFWTPSTFGGNRLIERLGTHAGLEFSVVQ